MKAVRRKPARLKLEARDAAAARYVLADDYAPQLARALQFQLDTHTLDGDSICGPCGACKLLAEYTSAAHAIEKGFTS